MGHRSGPGQTKIVEFRNHNPVRLIVESKITFQAWQPGESIGWIGGRQMCNRHDADDHGVVYDLPHEHNRETPVLAPFFFAAAMLILPGIP